MNQFIPLAVAGFMCASLGGCTGRDTSKSVGAETSPADLPASTSLPSLLEMPLHIPYSELPDNSPEYLAVSSRGVIAYLVPPSARGTVLLFDSTGSPQGSFGREGEGPGEILAGGQLYALDSTFIYLSPERRQVVEFTPDGHLRTDMRDRLGYLVITSSERALLLNSDAAERHRATLETVDQASDFRHHATLLPMGDTLMARFAGLTHRSGRWPVGAAQGNRIAIADGYSYTVALINSTGETRAFSRSLPVRLRTPLEMAAIEPQLRRMSSPYAGPNGRQMDGLNYDSLRRKRMEDTLPHFVPGGIGFDYRGRLWVVGSTNDSTFLDVFSDTTFLGRIMLACRDAAKFRATAIRGRWVAMSCEQADEEHPYTIRLFKISG